MAFEQHRDKNGEMSRKRGNTLIRTLRKHCRAGFPAGCADTDTLGDVLHKMDEPSLSKLWTTTKAASLSSSARAEGPRQGRGHPLVVPQRYEGRVPTVPRPTDRSERLSSTIMPATTASAKNTSI